MCCQITNTRFQNYLSTDGTKRYLVSSKIVPFDGTLTVAEGRERQQIGKFYWQIQLPVIGPTTFRTGHTFVKRAAHELNPLRFPKKGTQWCIRGIHISMHGLNIISNHKILWLKHMYTLNYFLWFA